MNLFVDKNSIVRQVWGKADTILFIFAGASAEFAVNKAVDWLYYTGKLPADPLGRLFSTVEYARMIIFSDYDEAIRSIDKIAAIHRGVEASRGRNIPDWAYRDVLFMLIDYSIRSFELLERKLSDAEKREIFLVFYRVGHRMGLTGLPADYEAWVVMRAGHLQQNLVYSHFSKDLYRQYKKHLGFARYQVLRQAQQVMAPPRVRRLLSLGEIPFLAPVILLYKFSRKVKLDKLLKEAILPQDYQRQINALDRYARQ
ncbi:oxygenase MpaB family protein [Hufsiella ginkgonis]|uniref:DUF2236 domain-containing protein n=1 Tax=Hufsiella ginkgonis TaxID=2695274 RepID=A0A7K1XXX2_9SPHI|nr:oxygenase MpaB family protein [Hufsiella ginkgonis]MXV15678.1 DUF2236 domain-containing protein [Hufsiella ginkgonis]